MWWYLDLTKESSTVLPSWLASLFTFQILYNYMIPISMYAMIEIVNSGQALMIAHDVEMQSWDASKPKGEELTAAAVRTPALCAELGQVRFVFSDKTGTLTQNKMELKGLSVAESMYLTTPEEEGASESALEDGASAVVGVEVADSTPAAATGLAPLRNSDALPGLPRRALAERAHDASVRLERKMALMLAVSHEVEIQQDGQYSSASPDELAFVLAARELGFNFNKYVDDEAVREVVITPPGPGGAGAAKDGAPVTMRFLMTHYNLFNSTRKRASVVFRDSADGNKYKCWAKGADTFMLSRERLRGGQDEQIRVANEQLSEYGLRGLRTLVFTERILTDAEWEAFAALHHTASKTSDVKERAALLDEAAALVENEMTYVASPSRSAFI